MFRTMGQATNEMRSAAKDPKHRAVGVAHLPSLTKTSPSTTAPGMLRTNRVSNCALLSKLAPATIQQMEIVAGRTPLYPTNAHIAFAQVMVNRVVGGRTQNSKEVKEAKGEKGAKQGSSEQE